MEATFLYYVEGEILQQHLTGGNVSDLLMKDMELLLKQPLVIRTDVKGETAFLLARTDTVRTFAEASTFFLKVLDQTMEAGRELRDVCFIMHRYIPAAASAFSFAKPGNRRVRVDAIWGLPDGLEFCTHDSYEVDAKAPQIIEKRVRFKPTFLANLPSGEWKATPLAPPFNWQEAIEPEDIIRIATASQRLAELKQEPLVIIWFARIPQGCGHPDLMPWRSTTESAPREVTASAASHFFGDLYPIRNDGDLANLERSVTRVSAIVFRPDEPHLRDDDFLRRLAKKALTLRLPVNLEGSFLAHAYYVLRKAGAHVECIDPIHPRPVATKFRKLVRDDIPVKIRRSGELAETATLLRSELVEVLKTKLVEEALEVLSSSEMTLREEMADVYEVLRAMSDALGCTLNDVKRDADAKRAALGGFQEGIVLVETKDMPLITVDDSRALFATPVSSRTVETRQTVGVAGRRAKSQIDRIVLPLIPPVPSRHRGNMRVEIRQLNSQFRIEYTDKTVEVIFEGKPKVAPRGQLDLF